MKTICMKTNEEITSYEPENFEENHKAYLVDLLSTNYKTYPNKEDAEKERKRIWEQLGGSEIAYSDIYIDPDNKKNEEFYRELSNFLNASRISRKNNKILSFEANEAPYGMITVHYKGQNGKEYGFRLHSDQLGFSAVPCIYFRNNYPLSRYLEMQKNKLDKRKNKSNKATDAVADFLAGYVYTTRTLGGSFLWPESWYKAYNMSRGNGSYIEDRVDLTLLEIKHIYKFRELENQLIYGKDHLLKQYKNQYADKWFGFFDSFEDYVDFFMFNDFVEDISTNGKKEYMPINILTGKRFKTDYPGYEMDTLKDIKEYKLKEMLERVRDMVANRTKKMEDLINEYKQTNDIKGETNENILHE
jgi:hypothetical protein